MHVIIVHSQELKFEKISGASTLKASSFDDAVATISKSEQLPGYASLSNYVLLYYR